MAIIKYVPKQTTIRDRRSEKGGYYEATCEECGKTFYPAKIAKYCSQLCTQRAYIKRKRAGDVQPRQKRLIVNQELVYAKNVIELIHNRYSWLDETFLDKLASNIRKKSVSLDTNNINNAISFEVMEKKEHVFIFHIRMSAYQVKIYK